LQPCPGSNTIDTVPKLDEYRKKRDFSKTSEPPPGEADDTARNLVFVVQQHAARRMHWDFRLEVDGVLKSWPLPKGPSLNPRDRRMAVMVEDHPYDYRNFEGVIPKGEYGGGQVIIWDEGTYSPDEGGIYSWDDKEEANRRMREGLANGKLSFTMRGRKLRGSFTLVKTRRAENDWLLIKHRDDYASERDVLEDNRSVRSGLTIEDLKEGRVPGRTTASLHPQAKQAPLPDSRKERPMLATLVAAAHDRDGWLWEPKLDGIRVLAFLHEGKVELRSRRGNDITRQYPALCEALRQLPGQPLVIDGEICALDEAGVPRFQLLQERMNLTRGAEIEAMESRRPVVLFVFDLLYFEGWDLRPAPLRDRKALLEARIRFDDTIRFVTHVEGHGGAMLQGATSLGFEGVVGKRADSRYESGVRSRSWVKVKSVSQQEFVVGGYTPGEGGRRSTFGALAVGYYDDGKLRYAGNVGSGFKDRDLNLVLNQLREIETEKSPFDERVEGKVFWTQPRLVAEVKYAEWTHDNRLRAPVFLGLRSDIDPKQVRRETPLEASVEVGGDGPKQAEAVDHTLVDDVLAQLDGTRANFVLEIEGERIKLTNLDKEFWPPYGEAPRRVKRDLIRYYARVAPYLLPHLKDRPLTLTRYPNGITGGLFYQKHYPQPLPAFVETVDIWSSHRADRGTYILCSNLPTLIWLAQIADMEIHAWMSRTNPEPDAAGRHQDFYSSEVALDTSSLNFPDFMIFDLDPYIYSGKEKKGAEPEFNRRAWEKTVEVALALKDLLDQMRLSSFLKTTGKTGIHVYCPVQRQFDYATIREMTQSIGGFLMSQRPKDITMEWSTEKRTGKVFFDANQNTIGKTLAAQYSLRPTPWAGVSMPVTWSELGRLDPLAFNIDSVPIALARYGDPWADILAHKNDLSALIDSDSGA
jgi:bifunctional non-homologous end joining protein LigD